ncbi:hypothetical protein [Leptolyngbya sp. PCC 6406]|uniref:hypothetical protein n=1 Tax=Leptolyngbya sp. PCC 6406 TaxID=1173264 RepID=UPI0002ABF7B1|nr:hypothetical protein [Leptolyngbya sp. PCC 6406]
MGILSLLDRAKMGDADAIADLINPALQGRGLTVHCDRQGEHLTVWVSGATLPPENATALYLRQGIERLQIPMLRELHIYAEQTGKAEQTDKGAGGWRKTMILSPAPGPSAPHLQGTASGQMPAPASARRSAPYSHPHGVQNGGGNSGGNSGPPPSETSWEQTAAIADAYQHLRLPLGAPFEAVKTVYFQQRSVLIRQGERGELEPLKTAYLVLKAHLEALPSATDSSGGTGPLEEAEIPALTQLPTLLQQRGFSAQVALRNGQLHIGLPAARTPNPAKALAQIYTFLAQQDLAALGLGGVETLVVSGLSSTQKSTQKSTPKIVWKRTALLPRQDALSPDNTDLFSFRNRYSNTYIFPALLVLGMVMNALPIVNWLLFGIKIWFHEFGHATVAWLAGRRALPLPLGWTAVDPTRSLFVYFGLLILFGLLFAYGRKEQHRWPMILAVVLMVMQFAMTWLMPAQTFDMLLSFGGIGGELYLCALLMVSFYFPLPQYFRWDFYRYPVVLGAAFCFWGQFWLWKQIVRFQASIPWGAMWGDPDHGDMNRLANIHHWTPGQIMGTYNAIANLCLIAILGVYLYFFWKYNRQMLFALSQRWIARSR